MVVGCAKRLIRASITDAIDISHDLSGIMQFLVEIYVVFVAIKA
jgi:hypothetical protein